MMPKGVFYPAQSVTVILVGDRVDLNCPGVYGLCRYRIRIGDNQSHPDGTATERFGTKVFVRRRFVGYQEIHAVY